MKNVGYKSTPLLRKHGDVHYSFATDENLHTESVQMN